MHASCSCYSFPPVAASEIRFVSHRFELAAIVRCTIHIFLADLGCRFVEGGWETEGHGYSHPDDHRFGDNVSADYFYVERVV